MPDYRIPCIIKQQRDLASVPKFALFSCPAGQILQWAAVRRREDDPDGPQRRLSRAKINGIKRFLNLDGRNCIPPAVTLTLRIENTQMQQLEGTDPADSIFVLEFSVEDDVADADKPGIVIDGQHRLFGMSEFDPNLPVNVVALLNAEDMETAFQFLVINNKSTKVSSDLIRTLALDYQNDELAERLRTARLTLDDNLKYVGLMDSDTQSPFAGHITLVTHTGDEDNRFVSPSAIENAVSSIQRKNVKELGNEDALCDFFYAIWRPTIEKWPELWNAESKLTHKVSVVAFTMFVTEALISKYDWDELDVTNAEEVAETTNRILANLTPEFWTCEWNIKISDAKAVRDKIIESLTQISRNIRSDATWNEDVEIVVL
jgi:DGQHR domain-containing protein